MEAILIREVKDHPLAFDGAEQQAWLPPGAAGPSPQTTVLSLGIYALADGFSLVSSSSNPTYVSGDTWHASLDAALAQAESQFGVTPDRWQVVAA